jgi:hypothetical protein
MSLNWNVAKVADGVCWEPKFDSKGNPVIGDDGKQVETMRWETDALIWQTMIIGLNNITEGNVDEWVYRLSLLAVLDNGVGTRFVDDKWVRTYLTESDVRRHIGLYTNATQQTRKEFEKRFLEWVHERGIGTLRDAEEDQADFEQRHTYVVDKGWYSVEKLAEAI